MRELPHDDADRPSCHVPSSAPLDAAARAELEPLLEHLAANLPAPSPIRFPRGALFPDGRLDLCKQGLGPEGVRAVAEALRHNTFVESLLLGADGIGDAGARTIAELMQENRSITTVFLGCNGITAAGAATLAEALQAHPTLSALWIKRNPIGTEGATALCRASARLRTLDLVQTGLDAGSGRRVADAILDGSPLERLYLSGNRLDEGAASWIGALVEAGAVRFLYLSANRLGDAGAGEIARALSAARGAIAEDRALVELSLGSNGIGAAGIDALAGAIGGHAALRSLDLGRARSAGVLEVDGNVFDDHAAGPLAALVRAATSLERLNLAGEPLGPSVLDAVLDALEDNRSITHLALGRPDDAANVRLRSLLARNRAGRAAGGEVAPDLRAIRSGYRARAPGAAERTFTMGETPNPRRRRPPVSVAEAPVTEAELASCAEILRRLTAQPERFLDKGPGYAAVRAQANRLIEAIRGGAAARKADLRRAHRGTAKAEREARDSALVDATGIRAARRSDAGPAPDAGPAEARELSRARRCYVCKATFTRLDAFYDALCPGCAAHAAGKRVESADLDGRVALVTGGRTKIGFHTALKLLRAGAEVLVTTRFPCDATLRFAGEPDFEALRDRIEIHGLDLRHLGAVERFASDVLERCAHLDILIHNAAQTVRRPPAYYEPLLEIERRGAAALPAQVGALIHPRSAHAPFLLAAPGARAALPGGGGAEPEPALSALLSQISLIVGDGEASPELFAAQPGGEPGDRRGRNSWVLELGDVDPIELVEVHHINALAPFILTNRLLPLLLASPFPDRYVVNVSAMEGKFDYANKQSAHPHTNMAKAALNMLTRTAGPALARRGIHMNSVDTGWITNENPFPMTERMRRTLGFEPPLDEIEGASRVLDPVFTGVTSGTPVSGQLFKDYRPTTW